MCRKFADLLVFAKAAYTGIAKDGAETDIEIRMDASSQGAALLSCPGTMLRNSRMLLSNYALRLSGYPLRSSAKNLGFNAANSSEMAKASTLIAPGPEGQQIDLICVAEKDVG